MNRYIVATQVEELDYKHHYVIDAHTPDDAVDYYNSLKEDHGGDVIGLIRSDCRTGVRSGPITLDKLAHLWQRQEISIIHDKD